MLVFTVWTLTAHVSAAPILPLAHPDSACLQICSLDFNDASVDALLAYMKSQSASFEELLDQRRGTRQSIAAWQVCLLLPVRGLNGVQAWAVNIFPMQRQPFMASVLSAVSLIVAM